METFTKEAGSAGFTINLQGGHIYITRIGADKSERTYRNVEEGTWDKVHHSVMTILAESTRTAIATAKLQQAQDELTAAMKAPDNEEYHDISDVLNGGHSEDDITDEELREAYEQYE